MKIKISKKLKKYAIEQNICALTIDYKETYSP